MQGFNTNFNFPQHGETEGVNPGTAPSVSASSTNFSGAQNTPSAPTRHISVFNHQRAVPNSPISSPLDPCDAILNYLVHQGILNSDLSLGTISYRLPVTILATFQSRRYRRT